jgi:hypothetical protein
MNDHIIDILDAVRFDALSETELAVINKHSADCADCGDCRSAFQAARISAAVLKFEAEESVFEPTPFFQTKVMAALREQQETSRRSIWDFWRVWQASGPLVSLMVLVVAGLMFASVLAPVTHGDTMASFGDESEAVIFEQDNTLRDISNEQVFPVIFDK